MFILQYPKNNLINQKKGFTLLEMTIALGIFVVLFTLTLGIYSASLKAAQRTVQMSKLQKEAQLIMEMLAKKIRSSRVDYDYYLTHGGINASGEETLALLDKTGNQTVFRFNSDSLEVCIEDCSLEASFRTIPSQDVSITDLTFFITPFTSPFSLHAAPTEFPKVTVVVNFQNIQGAQTQDLLVQQTIPQRLAGF